MSFVLRLFRLFRDGFMILFIAGSALGAVLFWFYLFSYLWEVL